MTGTTNGDQRDQRGHPSFSGGVKIARTVGTNPDEKTRAYRDAIDNTKLQLKAEAVKKFAVASRAYTSAMYEAFADGANDPDRNEDEAYDRYQSAKNALALYFSIHADAEPAENDRELIGRVMNPRESQNGETKTCDEPTEEDKKKELERRLLLGELIRGRAGSRFLEQRRTPLDDD